MKNTFLIETEIGVITVSKKEYLYHKKRVTNEICPDYEIMDGNNYRVRYANWFEEVDVSVPADETTTLGYLKVVKSHRYQEPFTPSVFEKELLENVTDQNKVLKLVDRFLKERGNN